MNKIPHFSGQNRNYPKLAWMALMGIMVMAVSQNACAQTANSSVQTDPGFANAQNNMSGSGTNTTSGTITGTGGSTPCNPQVLGTNCSTGSGTTSQINSSNPAVSSGTDMNTMTGNSSPNDGIVQSNQTLSTTGIAPPSVVAPSAGASVSTSVGAGGAGISAGAAGAGRR